MEQNTTKQTTAPNKKAILIIGAILAVLLIIYIAVSVFFMSHFHLKTTINGVNISGASVEEAKEKVQNEMRKYELVIVGRNDVTDTISGEDIGLEIAWENQVDNLMQEQNCFAWIFEMMKQSDFTPEVKTIYDTEKLQSVITGLSCMAEENQVAPQNAGISEYSTADGYTLIPAVQGSQIKQDTLQQSVTEAVESLKSELNLDEANCYAKPEIDDDNETLLNTIAQLNKTLKTVITYQIGSSTEVLDASVFQPWMYVDENMNVCIKDEDLTAYVKDMASKYNTCYSAKKLMTSYGREVTIKKSDYGWKVNNSEEKEAILNELMAGEPVTRDLHYSMTANSREGHDYGNSYIEINLTAQHLFLYINGKLIVETDFVSGNTSRGWDTPTGAYGITYKDKDAVLNGADYSTPVTYWMPYAGNVGMHDATWRDDFGGSIYKRNGSHGCINLPKAKAKIIFENVTAGFPVLSYTLEGTQSEKGNAQDQAYAMTKTIKAIGTVTLASEQAILSARAQYDALSDLAKSYVTNYQTLVDAEAALAALTPIVVPQPEPETETESEVEIEIDFSTGI